MNGLAMLPFWGISVPGLNTTSRWEEPDFNAQPVTDTQHAPVEVTMMIANIYRLNTDYERVTQHVLEASADIVALVEVTKPAYFVLIKQPGIQKRFPHHYYSYSNCSLLLSKTPLLKAKEVDADGQYLNSILVQATTRIAGRDLALWVTHPPHSTDRLNFLKKRDFLDFFRGRPLPENLLLVGDLNMTPWSNHFQEFLDITQLKSASTGFGFQPTWPVKRDFPVVFPIDHAFYKGAVSIEDWHVEPSLGSDHLPVRFVFKLY
jgi:endonuclease/exonuclease/phosphatase (EEP) superfamily protein YafD